eukprot:jgi/Botrbrau1/12028/Bobra.0293s0005.1
MSPTLSKTPQANQLILKATKKSAKEGRKEGRKADYIPRDHRKNYIVKPHVGRTVGRVALSEQHASSWGPFLSQLVSCRVY